MSKDNDFSLGDEPKSNAVESQAQASAQPQAQQQYRQPGQAKGLVTLNTMTRRTAFGNEGNRSVKELIESLVKCNEHLKNEPGFPLLNFVAVENDLKINGAAVYHVVGDKVLIFNLMLDNSSVPKTRESQIQNPNNGIMERIVVEFPTARYHDSVYQQVAADIATRDANAKGLVRNKVTATVISYAIIPESIAINEEKQVAAYYDSAVAAIVGYMCNINGMATSPYKAEQLANSQIVIVAKNSITPGEQVSNAYGVTYTKDFSVTLNAKTAVNDPNDLHGQASDLVLSAIAGYVDFARHTPDPAEVHRATQMGQAVPGYDPYIVITDTAIIGNSVRANEDLLTTLLGLFSVTGIGSANRWAPIFNRNGIDRQRKASIGNLNMEHNPFPGNPNIAYTKQALKVVAGNEAIGADQVTALQVIQNFCRNTMTIAMDFPLGGPQWWVHQILADATPGSTFEEIIIRELNAFSNGIFSTLWDRGQPIYAMPNIYVQLGYYLDEAGNKRDIRSIDYLTALELCNGDERMYRQYLDAFMPGNCDDRAMYAKRQFLESVIPSVVFTGIAQRNFFNIGFLNAGAEMLTRCNLGFRSEGLYDISGMNTHKVAFDSNLIGELKPGNLFQSGYQRSMNGGTQFGNFGNGGNWR